MSWDVLGIEPTVDKKAITQAYRALLVQTNPEDKPEEFKALREAYEQALSWAAQQEALAADPEGGEGSPLTPEGQWTAALVELYGDIHRRIDPAQWLDLLSRDVAVALDSRPHIEIALVLFLLHNNNLPQEIWQLLDRTFNWIERREELYEHYPRIFVDHVLVDGANYPNALPYELFIPGVNADDCDAYLDLYLQALRCEWHETPEFLVKMEALSESHPYGLALSYHAMAVAGDGLGVVKLLELMHEYPQDAHIKSELAEVYLEGELWEQCEKLVRELREDRRADRRLMWMLAQALVGQKRYTEGVELLGDLMHAAGGDQKELQELSEIRKTWNNSLIEQYEQRVQQGECDDRLLFELSWCYLQNERNEEAVALIERLDKDKLEAYEYYNLTSQAFLATERYVQAFEDSKALVEVVRAMQPDGTEKTDKRIARLAEMVSRCGDALYALKRVDEALPYYEEAAQIAPDSPERLTHYSRVMASLNRWPEAAHAIERLVELVPNAYHAHYLLAQYFFEMRNDRDAFYRVNCALDLEKGDLGVYVLKLRILLRNGALQEAADELRFLEDNQCGNYLPVLWCKAIYAEATDPELIAHETSASPEEGASSEGEEAIPPEESTVEGNHLPEEGFLADGTPFKLEHGRQAARHLYQCIYERLLEGEEMDWAGQICFRLALLSQDDQEDSADKQLEILNKGLELDSRDENCLDFKAWLLCRMNRDEEAIETYLSLKELPHEGVEIERTLAQLYAKDFERNADKALAFYRLVLEEEPDNPVTLYYAGLQAYYARDYALAESYFLREQGIEPDCPDSYRLLAFVYEAWGRLEEALHQCDELLRVAKEAGQMKLSHFARKVQVLRRLGRTREAVETAFRASFAVPYEEVYADVSEIYLQVGHYDDNARHLDAWSRAGKKYGSTSRDPGGLAHAQVVQELLAGSLRRAKHFVRTGRSSMTTEQRFDSERLVASFEGDLKTEEALLMDYLEIRKDNDLSIIAELADLAQVKWRQGEGVAACRFAEKALEEIDRVLLPFSARRPLYLTKRALMLALLGRFDEAQADLAEARALPLCEQCVYCACKDADYFEAYIDLISGNMQASLEKTLACMKRWPDETDFLVLKQELKRRGAL